jgi:hypothetical protein
MRVFPKRVTFVTAQKSPGILTEMDATYLTYIPLQAVVHSSLPENQYFFFFYY